MANPYARDLSVLVPDGHGYSTPEFVRTSGDYTVVHRTLVSDEGYRGLQLSSRLYERDAPIFAALDGILGTCEHGELIADLVDDGVLHWSINDYICQPAFDEENIVWDLWGMHEDGEWCFARTYFRGVVSDYHESGWQRPLLEGIWNVDVNIAVLRAE